MISSLRVRALAALTVAACLFLPADLGAQGLQNPDAIDTIVGSDVSEHESHSDEDAARVIAAIEKSGESARAVRMTTNLERVEIVFLPDAAPAQGGPPRPIEAKLAEHSDDVAALRQEIEGNALIYHAINSRQILVRDVLAMEFDGEGGAVVYAAAKKGG